MPLLQPAPTRSAVYLAYNKGEHEGQLVWRCNLKKACGDVCHTMPGAGGSNTTNLWTHLRLHHSDSFICLKKFGCLPKDRPATIDLLNETPNIAIRPRLTPKQRDHAHRLAAEFIVDDGEALSKCESKRLRAWVGYVGGQSYVPPCDDTIDAHVQIIADDGRCDSKAFNVELAKDGIKLCRRLSHT